MDAPKSKAELLDAVRAEHAQMEELLALMNEWQLTEPLLDAQWSVKDSLAHLTAWEKLMLTWVESSLRGVRPVVFTPDFIHVEGQDDADLDRFNAELYAASQARTLDEVLADFREAHRQVIAVLSELAPADIFDPQRFPWRNGVPLLTTIASNTFEHYHEHREWIQARFQLVVRSDRLPINTDLGPEAQVSLRELTMDTVRTICRLSDTLVEPYKYMVAPNAISIAQAHFEPRATFRAVYADETPVGFIMWCPCEVISEVAGVPGYFLWRFMIAMPYQGKGFGRRALELLIQQVRSLGASELRTSCGQGAGSPEGFYRGLGFERDGVLYDDEIGLRLRLGDTNAH